MASVDCSRASSIWTWNAGHRTISGWQAAVACCSGCRKASVSSRCRVRRRPRSMHVGTDGQVWLSEDGRLSRYRWSQGRLERQAVVGAEQGYPAISARGWSMRRGCVGNQCAWPGAHRGRRPECAPVWRARWPAEPGIPRTHAGDVGRRSSGGRYTGRCGGVRPEAGTSVDAACAAGDRAGGGAPQRAGAGPHDAPLQIADGDRDLRIVARLLSFADSASNTYRYRLAGYDPDWVEVGPAGERLFSRLAPGSYRLEVQARSADHVWSRVQSLEFRVQPPWWRSLSGLLMLASFALLLTSWFAWLYRRRLQRRHAYQLALHKQELAEQASAKTRFLANLGHEIRTPMTGVLGMSELLLASPLDPQQRGYTQSIRHAGEHLLHLVNDALDLARIESGTWAAAQAVRTGQPAAGPGRADGAVGGAEGPAFHARQPAPAGLQANGDAMRVRQILLNLLSNAVKFTSRGTITLHARSDAELRSLHFEVRDTGGHQPGTTAAPFPPLRAGRWRTHRCTVRWQWPGPGNLPRTGACHARADPGGEPARSWHLLRRDVAVADGGRCPCRGRG